KYDFTDEQQIKLAYFFEQMNDRSAFLMLSNSDPKNVDCNDNFFDKLYENFHIYRVRARRMINSKSEGRGFVNEILVTNYVVM
ncbi:MAG TPA: DNA adenine methylase, partial [Fervidobacterium sp.]|nr:DNA adenine methylase [Fervidobacterium sp.]